MKKDGSSWARLKGLLAWNASNSASRKAALGPGGDLKLYVRLSVLSVLSKAKQSVDPHTSLAVERGESLSCCRVRSIEDCFWKSLNGFEGPQRSAMIAFTMAFAVAELQGQIPAYAVEKRCPDVCRVSFRCRG